MKKIFFGIAISVLAGLSAQAQLIANPDNVKEEVFNQVPNLSNIKGTIITNIRIAKEYFMNSTDQAAGHSYQERWSNLLNEVRRNFSGFKSSRTSDYGKVSYTFTDHIECKKSGNDGHLKLCGHTMPINEGCTITNIEKTQNGNLKRWERKGNTFIYAAGKTKRGNATINVKIQAVYSPKYITETLLENDLNQIRAELNSLNLPTDLSI